MFLGLSVNPTQAARRAIPKRRSIVAFGDSLTAGAGASDRERGGDDRVGETATVRLLNFTPRLIGRDRGPRDIQDRTHLIFAREAADGKLS